MAEESPDSSRTELPYTERGTTDFSGLTTGIQPRSGITPADLPESWGGRPTGTSRRAIRMQKEWDDQRKREIEDYNIQRQAYENDRTYGLQMRDQMIQEAEYQRKQEEAVANQKLQAQARLESTNILSAINRLDPRSQDFESQVAEIMANNPLGTTDEAVQKTLGQYSAASQVYRKAEEDRQRKQELENTAKTGLAKDLGAYGLSIADFTKNGVIDFVAANEAVGKAYSEGEKAKVGLSETKEERKNIAEKITSAEKELLKVRARVAAAQKRVEERPTVKDFKTEFEAATIEQGILEDEINRLNRLSGGEAASQPQQGTTGQRPPLSDIFGGSR